MSPDAILLAKAIVSLQPSPDYMKDYVFPITLAFFSALLGGMSAIYINRKQDLRNITKDNFIAANQTFVMAHECLNNLTAIKANYSDMTSTEPLYRAISFPTMIAKLEDVKFSTSTLYFIRIIPTANKPFIERTIWKIKHKFLKIKVPSPSSEEIMYSWRNTVRISSMFNNYNQVMEFLRIRNELNEQVKEPLSRLDLIQFNAFEQLYNELGRKLCGGYVDITEQIIALADHVMIELHKFMLEFTAIAESNIELNRIKEWGKLPTYENNQPLFLKILQPIVKPDYVRLSGYVGITEKEAIARYTYRDWEKPS